MKTPNPMSTSLPDIGKITTAQVDGLEIRYARSGKSDGIPVLLTSPWPESIFAFRGVLPAIEDLHPLIAVDLPGFGRSDGRPDLMSPEAMGDFVIKLAQHFGIARLHAVGPDVGTLALLFAAVRSPGLFESIVVGSGATSPELAAGGLKDLIGAPAGASTIWRVARSLCSSSRSPRLSRRQTPFSRTIGFPPPAAGSRTPRNLSKPIRATFRALRRFCQASRPPCWFLPAGMIPLFRRRTANCSQSTCPIAVTNSSKVATSSGKTQRMPMPSSSPIGSEAVTVGLTERQNPTSRLCPRHIHSKKNDRQRRRGADP